MKQSDRPSILDAGSGLGGGGRPQILVVEDDDDLRSVVSDLLRDEDFAVIEAPHGQAALDYLLGAATVPSLILLDLNMPVMTGREMIRRLRDDPELAAIPVLVATSEPPYLGPPDEGTVGRLQKPYHAGHLIRLVRQHTAAAPDEESADDGAGEPLEVRLPRRA